MVVETGAQGKMYYFILLLKYSIYLPDPSTLLRKSSEGGGGRWRKVERELNP